MSKQQASSSAGRSDERMGSDEWTPKRQQSKYYKVKFQKAGDPNATQDVIFAVNGDNFQYQRGKVVIIPERVKEAADHSTQQRFVNVPGQDRQIGQEVMTYPYDLISEATEEEYLKQFEPKEKEV